MCPLAPGTVGAVARPGTSSAWLGASRMAMMGLMALMGSRNGHEMVLFPRALAFNLYRAAQFADPTAGMELIHGALETEPCGLDTYPCVHLRLEPWQYVDQAAHWQLTASGNPVPLHFFEGFSMFFWCQVFASYIYIYMYLYIYSNRHEGRVILAMPSWQKWLWVGIIYSWWWFHYQKK